MQTNNPLVILNVKMRIAVMHMFTYVLQMFICLFTSEYWKMLNI